MWKILFSRHDIHRMPGHFEIMIGLLNDVHENLDLDLEFNTI